MPAPYDYTVAQPDVRSYFDGARLGREDRLLAESDQQMSALSRYLPGALEGDAQAQRQALRVAPVGQMAGLKDRFMAMDTQKLAAMRQNQGLLASMAIAAKDPNSWNAVNAKAQELGLPQVPFEQREMVIAQAQTVAEALKAAHDEKMLANDTSRTTAQNSLTYAQIADLKAQRLLQAQTQAAGPKLSPRDENMLNEATKQSDAASKSIATMLNVIPNFKAAGDSLGPGAGWQRGIAGVLSSIPGVTSIEKALSSDGSSQSENIIDNFDRIEGASKKLGAELLQMFGGSDTQLELLTAIQTTIDPRKSRAYNEAIFRDQLAAADILSKKADLMQKWANAYGGVNRLNERGESWNSAWGRYQKAAWDEWRKQSFSFQEGIGRPQPRGDYRQEQRQLMNTPRGSTVPAPPSGFKVIP